MCIYIYVEREIKIYCSNGEYLYTDIDTWRYIYIETIYIYIYEI